MCADCCRSWYLGYFSWVGAVRSLCWLTPSAPGSKLRVWSSWLRCNLSPSWLTFVFSFALGLGVWWPARGCAVRWHIKQLPACVGFFMPLRVMWGGVNVCVWDSPAVVCVLGGGAFFAVKLKLCAAGGLRLGVATYEQDTDSQLGLGAVYCSRVYKSCHGLVTLWLHSTADTVCTSYLCSASFPLHHKFEFTVAVFLPILPAISCLYSTVDSHFDTVYLIKDKIWVYK